jgi:CHAT domain-containing protein
VHQGLLLVQQAGVLRRRRLLPVALDRLTALAPLVRPVMRLVADDPRHEVVVVPTGLLGLIPLHALPTGPGTEEVLDDVGEVTVAPSAAVYAACRSRAARLADVAPHLVAVGDPDGSLPGSRSELAEIRELFGPRVEADWATGPDATVGWLLEHLAGATHLHLSCHAVAGLDTRGSSLALADGPLDMDTLVRQRLPDCRLTVAGACQSGHYGIIETPDQFLGLPAGFLQAGAACAVTTLWQVNDVVTALLVTYFYELLHAGHDPVPALRRSRRWLRRLNRDELARYAACHHHLEPLIHRYTAQAPATDEPFFASAVHWAAFTAWGV